MFSVSYLRVYVAKRMNSMRPLTSNHSQISSCTADFSVIMASHSKQVLTKDDFVSLLFLTSIRNQQNKAPSKNPPKNPEKILLVKHPLLLWSNKKGLVKKKVR